MTIEKETIYKHVKRQTCYRIMCFPVLQVNGPLDNEQMVQYQDIETGAVYVRPKTEFFDGRFIVSRQPVKTPLAEIPEAALENAVNTLVYLRTQGEAVLEELTEEAQEIYREDALELLQAAMRGGIMLHNLPQEASSRGR